MYTKYTLLNKRNTLIAALFFLLMASCKKNNINEDPVSLAELVTSSMVDIGQTSATCNAEIKSVGGKRIAGSARILVSGICWSTAPAPTVDNNKTTSGPLIGTFSGSITGLQPSTTYYVRAYATNAAGTAYGDELTFTTKEEITIKNFMDNFNRSDVDMVDNIVDPNPIGDYWKIMQGRFGIENNRLATHDGGSETYMLYQSPEVDMTVGDGHSFKLVADITISGGSFGGIIFNAQNDSKRFYLLRTAGTTVQLLKTGNNGLNDWAAVMFNETVPGFVDNEPYRVEISSSNPGKFDIKIFNPDTNIVMIEGTINDSGDPYIGGVPGFYYLGLANPVNIFFDNFSLEIK